VDAELRGHITTLQALATSAALARGDLRTFYDEASRVLPSQPGWSSIILSDRDGRQLVNTGVAYGEPLGNTVENVSWQRVVNDRVAAVGVLARGPGGRYAVPVRVPVVADGATRYVITAPLEPRTFEKLIAEQHFPATWAVGLLDSTATFVARLPQRAPGERGSADLRAAIARAPEGWYRGRTLEGVDTFTAHRTSETTGWSVGVAVPSAEILAPAQRTAIALLLAALVSAGLAGAFAWAMGRRIAAPIAALAAHARALAEGRAPPPPPQTAIEEVLSVREALVDAGAAIHEREALRDREEVALKAADKAKDEFLAMLGHELRNPLSAITASAYVVRVARPGEHTALQAHGVIDRQTRHMTRLIDDLLDVSRLAMGKVSLRLERFDLAELARRVAQVWQHARVREPRELDVDIEPAYVDADRSRIEQVITNLLDNADKFSPSGTPIELAVRADEGEAVLCVVDHGQGIAPAMVERIFEAFVQGPQDAARARGGIGLGLTLVKRLVEMHTGTVEVFSEGLGRGARFTVRLPLVAGANTGTAAPEPLRQVASHRILVIEDNEDGRAMMEALLQLEGHQVRVAGDGASGVAAALEWRPEIVLIDIGLPDFDGREVARRLRAAGLPAKLVALSGYGQPEDERRSREAGFDLHLTKPVPPERLRSVLQALVPATPTTVARQDTRAP